MPTVLDVPAVPVATAVEHVRARRVVGVVLDLGAEPELALWAPVLLARGAAGLRVGVVGPVHGAYARAWSSIAPCVGVSASDDADAVRAWAAAGSTGGERVVTRDPDLGTLQDEFVALRHAAALEAWAHAGAGEWSLARHVGHQLRGTGLSCGFPLASALGAALETAVVGARHELARALLRGTIAYLGDVRIVAP